jgi:hypothetical protein
MRRRITLLIMAALLALTMALGSAGAAFAAPRQCAIGDESRGCNTEENTATQNPNDEIATIGKSGPHQCVEQGNSGKCRN